MRRVLLATSCLLAACVAEERRPAIPPASVSPVAGAPPPAPSVVVASALSPSPSPPPNESGLATWYGERLAGHRTASGERFDPTALTAAHRTLPLGTWVVVRLRATGQEVRVRINDRGPWGDSRRVIDVSRAAADAIGLTRLGVSPVDVWVVAPP